MVNLQNIIITGLTGMSGAGKSTVSRTFEAAGFNVIDCDVIARRTAENRAFLSELRERFPDSPIKADGTLDRALTAKEIFTDGAKRRLYNGIIFPYIVYGIISEIKSKSGAVVLDAPTLFDSGLDMICAKTVGVIARSELCAERITKRDGITRDMALKRLSAQRGGEFFRERCDYIIENNGELSDITESAVKIADKLKGTL